MKKSKVFILLPDGIGLRNFAYTNFYNIGLDKGLDLTFWNATPFPLDNLGFKEISLPKPKLHPFTEVYKNARKHIELNQFKKNDNDTVYDTYKFPFPYSSLKNTVKSILTRIIIGSHNSKKGLNTVINKINEQERSTSYYKQCKDVLEHEKPLMVFSTNQRPAVAIAPIMAAKDLNIPTATFIFSWDNLPKATLVIETDYYMVWSSYMKKELLKYYPNIKEEQVIVTGTTQFENHTTTLDTISRDKFFKTHGLDTSKKYICFSGDDVTTSPDDPQYLKDVAQAVNELNYKGNNIGVVFRRCPVDFSDRYDAVINQYKEIIRPINPMWKRISESWNTILPSKEDMVLQQQTIQHTEMVINLGSSMVFDYAAYNKPCAFINYDVANKKIQDWSVEKIYKYVHFKSMTSKESVIWLNNPSEIASKIETALNHKTNTVNHAKDWFKIINLHPLENASNNIVEAIKNCI